MDRYAIVEELGKGSHGTVWKAVDKVTGEFWAIKRLNGNFSRYEDCAEVKCLADLRFHPNILYLHDVILEGTTLYVVLELMDCDLSELQRRGRGRSFSEDEVRSFCFQILKGLQSMSYERYCHRDLKPQNLLVRGGTSIKIADFGLATRIWNNKPLESYVGTRPYRAPQLLLGSTEYGLSNDIWAIGVIMTELFTGYPIFTGSNALHQLHSICSVIGSPDTQIWREGLLLADLNCYSFPEEFRNVDSTKQLSSLLPTASAVAIDLINSLLSWDRKRRPIPKEALQHPFFYASSCLFQPMPLLPNRENHIGHTVPSSDLEGRSCNSYSYFVEQVTFTEEGTLQITPIVAAGVQQQIPFEYANHDGGNNRAIPTYSSSSCYDMKFQPIPVLPNHENPIGHTLLSSDLKERSCSNSFSYFVEQVGFTGEGTLQNNPLRAAGIVEQPIAFEYVNRHDGGNNRPTVDMFRSSYSIWQKNSYLGSYQIPASSSLQNLPSRPFPGMGPKLINPPHNGNHEDADNPRSVDQLRLNSEHSIGQQRNYVGSYGIPASESIENLPAYPFPGMGPKLLNRGRMPVNDDKIT